MNLDFAGLGKLDTPIAIEMFPDCCRGPNLMRSLRHLCRREIKWGVSKLLVNKSGRNVWDDDVFVLEYIGIRLPFAVDEDAGSPDRELFFAGVQSKRIGGIPIAKLRAASCNFYDFTHPGLCAVKPKLDRHGRVHFKML